MSIQIGDSVRVLVTRPDKSEHRLHGIVQAVLPAPDWATYGVLVTYPDVYEDQRSGKLLPRVHDDQPPYFCWHRPEDVHVLDVPDWRAA